MKVKKQEASNDERSSTAQSLAARARRRKISQKTQELEKLIPGGQKMNTAEMFQAAFKYVKFLQTQIGVLKHMALLPVMYNKKRLDRISQMSEITTCTT